MNSQNVFQDITETLSEAKKGTLHDERLGSF